MQNAGFILGGARGGICPLLALVCPPWEFYSDSESFHTVN